jgi:hypothetical protein
MTTNADYLQYVNRVSTTIPAGGALAIANTSTTGVDAIDNAESTQGYRDASTMTNNLSKLGDEDQRNVWSGLSNDQQAQLVGAGYQPPKRHRGVISTVVHDVLGAPAAAYRAAGEKIGEIPYVGDAVRNVKDTAFHAVGSTLNALGSGQRLTAHMYRAGELANIEADPNSNPALHNPLTNIITGIGVSAAAGASFLHLTDSEDWADAWHKTNHGERVFDPNKDRSIQQDSGYDDMTIGFAKALAAGGKDPAEYLAAQKSAGLSAEQVATLEAMSKDKKFQGVVQNYKDAHLSFGRSLVPQFIWDNAHPLGELISGVGDAAFSFIDPLLIGGKINKAYKLSKYGFKSIEEIDKVLTSPGAQRWLTDVAGYLQRGEYDKLLNRHNQLAPVITSLREQGIKTQEDLASKLKLSAPHPELKQAETNLDATKGAVDDLQGEVDNLTERVIAGTASDEHLIHKEAQLRKAMKDVGLAEIKHADELAEWTKGNIIALHILRGDGMSINHGVQMVPHLTAVGRAGLEAKGVMKRVIDWSADTTFDANNVALDIAGNAIVKPLNFVGQTMRKMVSLTPHGITHFDPNDANAITTVQRFSNFYLPAAATDALTRAWAMAPDIGTKRKVYKDMLEQSFSAAGFDLSDDATFARHFIDTVENGMVKQKYSANGNDLMQGSDGLISSAGLLEKHMTAKWALPSFKDMAANQQRSAAMSFLYKLANNPLTDGFSTIWKPAQLFRVAYPLRNTIEEVAGTMLREGGMNFIRASAGQFRKGQSVGGTFLGPMHDMNPLEAGLSRMARELDKRELAGADTVRKLSTRVLAKRTSRYIRVVADKIPHVDKYDEVIDKYFDKFENGVTGEISSIHTGSRQGWAADPGKDTQLLKDGMTQEKLNFAPQTRVKPNGDYMHYQPGQAGFYAAWMKELDDVAGSDASRLILNHINQSPEELRHLVADYMQSEPFKNTWSLAERSKKLSDGRVVGQDATEREAALDWADHLIKHVDGVLPKAAKAAEGQLSQRETIVKHLLDDKQSPHLDHMMNVSEDLRPKAVTGPEFVELPLGQVQGVLTKTVENGFHWMGHIVDHVSRNPLYIHAMYKADRDLRPIIDNLFGEGTKMAEEVGGALVNDRALAEIMPFLDNPNIRSQMNVITRNLAPFQHAQELFLKRWAKTFVHSPEALAKAQLAHHALGASGVTHKDDQGQEIFSYPASGMAQQAITRGLEAMGLPTYLPIHQAFTGQLKMVAPGFDISGNFRPSWGPLVTVPLEAVTRQFHELRPLQRDIVGGVATGRPYWEMIVPSTVSRIVNAATANDSTSPAYATAQMKAIQSLYAGGHGLPPNATAFQKEEFQRRVKNWTRINMFLKTLIGFNVPAAPASEIGDTQVGRELRRLSESGLTFSEAVDALTKADPNAFPYTVFMSEGNGKQPLPSTTEAAAMLEKKAGFFKSYPVGGGFFLPQKSSDDKFDYQAYKDQLLYELRKRKSPTEFLEDVMYAQASGDYWDTVKDYKARAKNLKGPAKQALDNQYQTWKADYFKANPVFADKVQSSTARVDRARSLDSVRAALSDPDAPKNSQTQAMQDIVDTWDDYQSRISQWAGMNSARATQSRKFEKDRFVLTMNDYLEQHPEGTDLYNSLIRSEVEDDNG